MSYQSRGQRRSTRLPGYDYRQPGSYFVTICTHEREVILDDPALKRAVDLALRSAGRYCRPASIDEFVVMPNHVHAIIRIRPRGVGAQHTTRPEVHSPANEDPLARRHSDGPCAAPLRARGPARRVDTGSLGAVVRAFKSASAKRVNAIRETPGAPVWQRNYYEHVIRGDDDLARVRQYVRDNPAKWANDPDNPANITISEPTGSTGSTVGAQDTGYRKDVPRTNHHQITE
jgi:putative transposase